MSSERSKGDIEDKRTRVKVWDIGARIGIVVCCRGYLINDRSRKYTGKMHKKRRPY